MRFKKVYIFFICFTFSLVKLVAFDSPFTGGVSPFAGGFDSRLLEAPPYNSTVEKLSDTTFTISGITGSGGTSQQYSFLYKTIGCDFDFITRISSYSAGYNGGFKMFILGIYAFDSDFINETYLYSIDKGCSIYGYFDPDATSEFKFTYKNVGSTTVTGNSFTYGNAIWVRLVRVDNDFYGYSSTDGVGWDLVGSADLSGIGDEIGISVYAQSVNCLYPFGRFDNISGVTCPSVAEACCENVLQRLAILEEDVKKLKDCCDKHYSGIQRDARGTRKVTGSGSSGRILVMRSPGEYSDEEYLVDDGQEY